MKSITKKINAYLTLNNRKTKELSQLLNKTPASILINIKNMTFRLDEFVAILDLDNNFLVVLNEDKSITRIFHKNNLPINIRMYMIMHELGQSKKHLAIINDKNEIIIELYLSDLNS